MLGAVQPCIICYHKGCLRHNPACDRCSSFCWMCRTTKADDNCDRCLRAAKKLVDRGEIPSHYFRAALLAAVVAGPEGITYRDADKLLKRSGLSAYVIRDAAGGGEAGGLAVKRAAVAFASSMHQKSQDGEDLEDYFVTSKSRSVPTAKLKTVRRSANAMTTPAAHEVVAQVGEKRLVEPFNRDAPAVALAAVSELFFEASNGVTDPLVVADLNRTKDYVQSEIVRKLRNPSTHRHGWRKSAIEALEKSARADAEKAIRRVLARSRAAVEAQRAKERPKKTKKRQKLAESAAKIKKAKADGTYKRRATGDTKIHWNRKAALRDYFRRVKSAFNKLEKYGPAACTQLDIARHAEHKAHLEYCAAKNAATSAARKGKK